VDLNVNRIYSNFLALGEYYVIILLQILSGLKPTHLLYKR